MSSRLRTLAQERAGDISLGDLTDAAGAGGSALLLLLLALASFVPGVAPAFGLAICLLGVALVRGRDTAPLPDFLRRRSVSRSRLGQALDRALPRLERIEAHLKPRLGWLAESAGRRVAGAAGLVNGVLIVLPVPFGNTLPAVAVLLLALGIGASDGLIVLAGLVASGVAFVLDALLVVLSWDAIVALFA